MLVGGDGAAWLLWFGGGAIAGIFSGRRRSGSWWWMTSGAARVQRVDLVRVGCLRVVLVVLACLVPLCDVGPRLALPALLCRRTVRRC